MPEFTRSNALFSLCALNCGLCSMRLGGHCPGCGHGNKPCKAARCGMAHGVAYCFQCGEYPCAIYAHADERDSFITHQHQKADMEKAKRIGIDAYTKEQAEKVKLLERLLSDYNDGRRKTLYCLAVNLLELSDLQDALEEAEADAKLREAPKAEKASYMAEALQKRAREKGVLLKLRK